MLKIPTLIAEQLEHVDDLLCGTVLVYFRDQNVVNRKASRSKVAGVYSTLDQDDELKNGLGKVVAIDSSIPKEVADRIKDKLVKVNYYSGTTFFEDKDSGDILSLINIEGILCTYKDSVIGA